jgi:HTH-type transcriptional regulator, transcriptional repressor of NAD biosynthesis genes
MIGVVIGKFYPPHRGHKFLIDTATAQVDHLTVIVCDHPSQSIPAALRAEWLREMHPNVTVVVTPDDEPDEPEPWARRTIEILGRRPDVVFTSEAYGIGYAAAMECAHVLVDLERETVPISATRIRANPLDHLDFLEPCVRAHFVWRVVLIGVESTGKTTLAKDLAAALQTDWVPEYGREYSLTQTGDWQTEDFVRIATEQQRQENETAGKANRVLICDTNAFTTTVWHRRYMGEYAPEVDAIGNLDRVDLYLLTLPDFPFVQDGTRDGEVIRHAMHEWFVERLATSGAPVVTLRGDRPTRLAAALAAIRELEPSRHGNSEN